MFWYPIKLIAMTTFRMIFSGLNFMLLTENFSASFKGLVTCKAKFVRFITFNPGLKSGLVENKTPSCLKCIGFLCRSSWKFSSVSLDQNCLKKVPIKQSAPWTQVCLLTDSSVVQRSKNTYKIWSCIDLGIWDTTLYSYYKLLITGSMHQPLQYSSLRSHNPSFSFPVAFGVSYLVSAGLGLPNPVFHLGSEPLVQAYLFAEMSPLSFRKIFLG